MQMVDVIKHNLPGFVLSVCKGGNPIQHYCAGYANLQTRELLSPKHIFQNGKITRMFTSAAILKCFEEGLLDLDAPLAVLSNHHRLDGGRLKLIVDLYPYLKPLTLRELLNNTSGLLSYDETLGYQKVFLLKPKKTWQIESYLDLISGPYGHVHSRLELPVRGKFSDSATNYIIASLMLEAVTGRKSSQKLQELFRSVELNSTYYSRRGILDGTLLITQLAHGYLPISHPYAAAFNRFSELTYNNNRELRVYDVTEAYNFNGLGGTASLSTTEDLIKWMRALCGGQILKSSLQEMFKMVPVKSKTGFRQDKDFYGLGVYKTISPQWGEVIWSSGNSLGYGVLLAHVVRADVTFVLATNVSRRFMSLHEPTLVADIFPKLLS